MDFALSLPVVAILCNTVIGFAAMLLLSRRKREQLSPFFRVGLNRVTVTVLIMPGEGQKTVTIPKFVWEKAVKYFEDHKQELREKGIKSATRLVTLWIEEHIYSE